jgi:site-specific recombinase XerD
VNVTELVKVEKIRIAAFDPIADIVLKTVDGNTRRAYGRALLGHYGPRITGNEPLGFLPWLAEQPFRLNRAAVNAYIAYLKDEETPPSSVNQRLAAIRKFVNEAAENGLIDHPTAGSIARIQNIQIRGKSAGNWLTKPQAEAMLNAPSMTTRKGKRDRAILALLLGAGLRREELVTLTVEHFQQRAVG